MQPSPVPVEAWYRVTVRDSYTALSNGRLLSVKHNTRDHTRTFHWTQPKPHAVYLLMLAIGEYAVIKDNAGALPLEYYVYPHSVDDARFCFRETPDMIDFLNRTIGFPYPWDKYAQVLIRDFVAGGMENTSATSVSVGSYGSNVYSRGAAVLHMLRYVLEGNRLLKELRFSRPAEEWAYQAEHAEHAIDRTLAVKELTSDTSAARPVALFARCALNDAFYAVRLEGVRALAATRPSANDDRVNATLVKATRDPKSIVRSAEKIRERSHEE